MSMPNVEIERKYIILKPDFAGLRKLDAYTVSSIVQTYLSSESGVTHRVRCRVTDGVPVYTETKKVRIDSMSSYEDEREISREEYEALLLRRDTRTHAIHKDRHSFIYLGQLFEIDVYPEWERSCILETELPDRERRAEFPDEIRVLLEVTGDKRYSNAAMSRSFPSEIV